MSTTHNFILGSASPQRKLLLERVGIHPEILIPDLEEVLPRRGTPSAKVADIAMQKFRAVQQRLDGRAGSSIILTADTLVFHRGRALGKARNVDEARDILTALSGSWHQVHTGVVIGIPGRERPLAFSERTDVRFRRLTVAEIEEALDFGDWRDAAGAYRIQGFASGLVERVAGCPSNVIGLPTARICGILAQYNFRN